MITLRMLCWSGYTEVLASYADELKHLDLQIDVEEEINADTIYARFIAGRNFYDVVVVDWEYRHRYKGLVLILKDDLVNISQYLEPFRQRYFYELGNQLLFVPLRFGTNGVVMRHNGAFQDGSPRRASVKEFLADNGEPNRNVGVWNWWLPNLLLLAKAADFRSPHMITASQLKEVTDGVLRAFSERISLVDRQKRHLFDRLEDIIEYELESREAGSGLDWVLGPSEMVVAPISCARMARKEVNNLRWEIPKEGGLVWLETAALSEELHNNRERKEAAFRFLRFLQSPPVQVALICGQRAPSMSAAPKTYWSYPLNNVDGIDAVPKAIRASFENQWFEASAMQFGRWISQQLDSGDLIMRALPDDYEPWQRAWNNALSAMDMKITAWA
jgi:spermidine/putrescine-binding protein